MEYICIVYNLFFYTKCTNVTYGPQCSGLPPSAQVDWRVMEIEGLAKARQTHAIQPDFTVVFNPSFLNTHGSWQGPLTS